MACTWFKTAYRGLRYRQHPTRKVSKNLGAVLDRYFVYRFSRDGEAVEEALGWESDGMTEEDAIVKSAELRKERRLGEGTGRISDRRKVQRASEAAAKAAEFEQAQLATTYTTFYNEHYAPSLVNKAAETARRERNLNERWIIPVIGSRPIRQLTPLDVERVGRGITQAGLAPRSVQYAQAAIRMVINHALRLGYFIGRNPVSDARKLKFDNRRQRFLAHGEADQLLQAFSRPKQANP